MMGHGQSRLWENRSFAPGRRASGMGLRTPGPGRGCRVMTWGGPGCPVGTGLVAFEVQLAAQWPGRPRWPGRPGRRTVAGKKKEVATWLHRQ